MYDDVCCDIVVYVCCCVWPVAFRKYVLPRSIAFVVVVVVAAAPPATNVPVCHSYQCLLPYKES